MFHGIENIPGERPLMFVGNHTMYGILDVPLLITELHARTGILLRGLGDELHFKVPLWRQLVTRYGVELGTRQNCSRLLEAGECVLVFPGGAREVAKRKGERYQLTWKERLGFARLAIQHGTTIVPVSAIGMDDAFEIWRDAEDIAESRIGHLLERFGVRRDAIMPVARRYHPERLYFRFGTPIVTTGYGGDPADDDACWKLRDRVQASLERDIDWLLHQRDNDPDRPLIPRVRHSARRAARAGAATARFVRRTRVLETVSLSGIAAFARSALRSGLGPHSALIFHAADKPDRVALVDATRSLTWHELDCEVNRLAHGLASLGVGEGDRVALMLRNCGEYIVAQQALMRIGAMMVQVGYRLKSKEVAYQLDNSTPAAVICQREFAEVVGEAVELSVAAPQVIVVGDSAVAVPHGVCYQDLIAGRDGRTPPGGRYSDSGGVMIYTSGTTGRPKGATRSFKDTGFGPLAEFMLRIGMTAHERHLLVCPLYHSGAYGFYSMVASLGGTNVLMDHFEPQAALRLIERERITSAFMVPTMLARLAALDDSVRARYDVSTLRWIGCSAAPLPTETARRFQQRFGPIVWNFYGATETGVVTLAGPDDHEARPGTIGRPLRGNRLRLLDSSGVEVPPGEVGELYVRNAMLIAGYRGDRAATAQATRDGYFSVGDLARIDRDGYVYLESRKSDMVISGGVNIYPREIEDHLCTHSDIVECAVVGVPDDEWGERLLAFVVRRADSTLDAEEVAQYCRDGLADYKRPRGVVFTDELPRNPTGKVLKNELRAAAQ